MLPASVPLFDREMLFVTGKGGVGKTTVAASLALAAARTGRRTIVCELAGQARIPALLGATPAAPGEETRIADGLWATTIVPREALEEWLARVIGSRQLTHLLARSNFFNAFVAAAPGAAELVAITKTWDLVQEHRWNKRRSPYDLVIVDGPASGHAVGMLRTPGTFADIARVGPIASTSQRVRDWLTDAGRTAYVAVALAAELPVSETIDLGGRLERALGRRLEAIVANEILPDRFTDAELDAVTRAAPDPQIADAIHAADGRALNQEGHLARLVADAGAPVYQLPFVFAPELTRKHVEALAATLPVP